MRIHWFVAGTDQNFTTEGELPLVGTDVYLTDMIVGYKRYAYTVKSAYNKVTLGIAEVDKSKLTAEDPMERYEEAIDQINNRVGGIVYGHDMLKQGVSLEMRWAAQEGEVNLTLKDKGG